MKTRLLIYLLAFFFCGTGLYAQCESLTVVPIEDNSTTTIQLDVQGLVNNDLALNNGICRVEVEFTHDNLGDLELILVSPAGQSVQLLGPVGAFGNTTSTVWDVDFLPCSETVSPDLGFSPTWNNDQVWGTFGSYSGSYHPFDGCLEDFNMGPANGVWTFHITDAQNFDLGEIYRVSITFCQNAGLECGSCETYAGDLTMEDLTACESVSILNLSDLSIEYEKPIDLNVYLRAYVIRQGNNILDLTSSVDLRSYPVGTYKICGVTYKSGQFQTLQDLAFSMNYPAFQSVLQGENSPICGGLSNGCKTVTIIDQPDTTFVEHYLCDGTTFEYRGKTYSDYGIDEYTISASNGCDSTFHIEIKDPGILASISATSTELNCDFEEIELIGENSLHPNGTNFRWSTMGGSIDGPRNRKNLTVYEPGKYILRLRYKGCTSRDTITITQDFSLPEFDPQDDTITCINPSIQLQSGFTGPFRRIEWSGPGSFTSGARRPRVDETGDYKIVVTKRNGCIDSTTISIAIDTIKPVGEISLQSNPRCEGDEILLLAMNVQNGHEVEWSWPGGSESGDTLLTFNSGEYLMTVINPENGCIITDTITIGPLLPQPDILNISYPNIDCYDRSVTLTLTAAENTYTYLWTGPDNFMSSSQSPLVFSDGWYYVAVNTVDGCSITDSIEVLRLQNPPELTLRADSIHCGSGSIDLRTSEPVDEIYWTGPADFSSSVAFNEVFLSGNYFARVETVGGCVVEDTIYVAEIEEFDTIKLDFHYDSLTCASTSPSLSYSIAEIHRVDSVHWIYEGDIFSKDSITEYSEPGWYTIMVFTDDGCIVADAEDIPIYDDSADISIDVVNFNCASDSGRLTLQSNEDVEITWTGPSGQTFNGQEIVVYELGEFYVEAINALGCASHDTVEVIRDTSTQNIELTAKVLGCHRDTVTIQSDIQDPNSEFQWTGPGGFTSTRRNPRVTVVGLYNLVLTGSNGCISTGEIEIIRDLTEPIVSIAGDTIRCKKPNVVLRSTVDTTVTYRWTSPSGRIHTRPNFRTGETGEYRLIVTAENSCTDTAFYTVVSDTLRPEYSLDAHVLDCSRDSVQILLEIEDLEHISSLEWSGPAAFTSSEQRPFVKNPGTYILEITLDNECIIQDEIEIIEDITPPDIALNQYYQLNCALDSIELDPELGSDYEISWIGPSGFSSMENKIYVSESGLYDIHVIGPNFCVSEKSIVVAIDTTLPKVTYTTDTLTCKQSKVQIVLDPEKGTYTYEWTGPDGFESEMQSPFVQLPGIYETVITDTNSCSTVLYSLVPSDTISPKINSETAYLHCEDGVTQLEVNTTTEIESYRWFGPNSFFSNEGSPIVSDTGVYTIEAFGENGCSSIDSVRVEYGEEIELDLNFEFYTYNCYSDSFLVKVVPNGAFDHFSYDWQGEGIPYTKAHYRIFTAEGDYALTLTEIESQCSFDTILQVRREQFYPNVEIEVLDSFVCERESIQLSGTHSFSGDSADFHWQSPDGEFIDRENTLTPRIGKPGTYILTVRDSRNNCISSDTMYIEEKEDFQIDFNLETMMPTCAEPFAGQISINSPVGGVPPYQVRINNLPFDDNYNFVNLPEDTFLLQVRDSYSCMSDTLITLIDTSLLDVTLPPDTIINLGTTLEVDPLIENLFGEVFPRWQSELDMDCVLCRQNVLSPKVSGLYIFTIVDDNGCIARDSMEIRVISEKGIYIPNAFSPNADQMNDMIYPMGSENLPNILTWRIYDRTGNLLFENRDFPINDPTSGWDGQFLGRAISPQTLSYIMRIDRGKGKSEFMTGTIELLR